MPSEIHEINEKIFNLLKEPLNLNDNCVEFTLTVSMEQFPLVEQSYYCRVDHDVKHEEHEVDGDD